jgi:CRISPR-associated protein Cmr5
MASLIQTVEQQRAAEAWKRVHDEVKPKEWAGEYRALVRGAATDILTSGLGQTLAFLRAKDKGTHSSSHWTLYTHLSEWVGRPSAHGGERPFETNQLLEWLIDPKQGSDVYRQVTVEVMAYLNWLKRFAEAELPEPKGA